MARRGPRALPAKGKAKPKKSYDLIEAKTDEGEAIHELIETVVEKYRPTLKHAKIGAAWMINRKPDRDGFLQLGRLKKCSELERQLHGLDAIVVLNQEKWRVLNEAQRIALMHHELCHLEPALDNEGEQAIDGHGKRKWRGRRHDIEEFRDVVATHGCYKADIADFARGLLSRDPQLALFDHKKPVEMPADAGLGPVPDASQVKRETLIPVKLTEKEIDAVNDAAMGLREYGKKIPWLASREGIEMHDGRTVNDFVTAIETFQRDSDGEKRMANGQTFARVFKKLRAQIQKANEVA